MGKLRECKYFIWGTGYNAVQLNQFYGEVLKRLQIVGYIDNNSGKWGSTFYGKEVYSPEILKQNRDSYIIIANIFTDEITKQIEKEYSWYKERIVEKNFIERMQLLIRYDHCVEAEYREIVNYLEEHPLQVFNYPFVEKYECTNYLIEYDAEKDLYFTMYLGKKMYFSRSFNTEEKVKAYYKSICLEQDEKSPHKYLTDSFEVKKNAVIIDAGVAEGNFSLSLVENAKKIFMFEPDPGWVEALRYTFEPYKDKVVIIDKCLSDYVDDNTTTIDEALKGEKIDVIKMDIEGEELYALKGAQAVISMSTGIKCLVCTYHQEFAYIAIKDLLKQWNFSIETSDGYMWYPDSFFSMRAPVLRKGLIRAEKRENDEK